MSEAKEDGIRRLIRFAFSDDDGDPDLSVLPEFAAALRKAEQRGEERGLANRDERCLQSDMQRIREKLAFERGAERERAAITAYGYQELGDAFDQLAIDINLGKHLKGEE